MESASLTTPTSRPGTAAGGGGGSGLAGRAAASAAPMGNTLIVAGGADAVDESVLAVEKEPRGQSALAAEKEPPRSSPNQAVVLSPLTLSSLDPESDEPVRYALEKGRGAAAVAVTADGWCAAAAGR